MTSSWQSCNNLLCIRPDNMGDILMTGPALRALKETWGCRITLLTSQMGALVTPHLPEIDETIICTLPWVKSNAPEDAEALQQLVQQLRAKQFDGAVLFTVYSQNPLPSALLAFMAGIPLRLGYCRENPYDLLTHWVPDKEPYGFIQHQVERDLKLVESIGATTGNPKLAVQYSQQVAASLREKLMTAGIPVGQPYLILHPGVSETKREVPVPLWREAATRLLHATGLPLLLTGAKSEWVLADAIQKAVPGKVYNIAGLLSIGEFMALVDAARVVVSVNTATAHIAAAVQTPVVVLYALTNPQHFPWMVAQRVLTFSGPEGLKSRNAVVEYVSSYCMEKNKPLPTAEDVVVAVLELLK